MVNGAKKFYIFKSLSPNRNEIVLDTFEGDVSFRRRMTDYIQKNINRDYPAQFNAGEADKVPFNTGPDKKLEYFIKNPPSGVKGVYFAEGTRPQQNNQYTLDELIANTTGSLNNIYIFKEKKVNIQEIVISQGNHPNVQKAIEAYIKNNIDFNFVGKVSDNPSYNSNSYSSKNLDTQMDIDVDTLDVLSVYFDGGKRSFSQK